jgi:hypothetical protein
MSLELDYLIKNRSLIELLVVILGLDLAFDFKNELIRRKKPEVNRRYFKLFGGKYKQLVDNTLYSPNPGRRQLAAIGTLVGAAYLGANAIKGGSYLINKARN